MVIEVGINNMQLAKVGIMTMAAIHSPGSVVLVIIKTINKMMLTQIVEANIPLLNGVLSFIIFGFVVLIVKSQMYALFFISATTLLAYLKKAVTFASYSHKRGALK